MSFPAGSGGLVNSNVLHATKSLDSKKIKSIMQYVQAVSYTHLKGIEVIPGIEPITDEVLDYEKVWANYKKVLSYVAELYVDTVNIIHYMHDKYAYEASQFALHDTNMERIAA